MAVASLSMSRAMTAVIAALCMTLAGFGLLADRALVGQARAARAAAASGAEAAARLTASAVRAALARIEEEVAARRAVAGVASERLAAPPPLRIAAGDPVPYGRRSREALSRLLLSDGWTPAGLPEAVVARIALGSAAPVSGGESGPDVEERLLSGQLPVRPEDLPHLARRLGVGGDPRVQSLQERLRRAPAPRDVPALPAFRRRLGDAAGAVEGWAREGRLLLRYDVDLGTLLERAGAAGRAAVALPGREPPATGATRVVAVPDVDRLELAVTAEPGGALRLAALRVVLWACLVAGAAGLAAARRALASEARAMARERRFLASVTHELRTPLAAIRLFGETLAEGRGDPREYGALVAQESERLDVLVERVLAATRVDEAPRFRPVAPAEIVGSAVALVAVRAERRRVRLDCRADAGLPQALWDAEAVRHALLNLLDNALKHGRDEGRVEVRAEGAGEHVRLSVADDGPGIGRGERDGIFGRFARGASAAPGTGLGLHLVEQVARAHGGRVDLVTERGRGSTFTLVLPLQPPGARPSAAGAPA